MQEALRVAEHIKEKQKTDLLIEYAATLITKRHLDGIQLTSYAGGKKSDHCKIVISGMLKFSSILW